METGSYVGCMVEHTSNVIPKTKAMKPDIVVFKTIRVKPKSHLGILFDKIGSCFSKLLRTISK